jgi:hypothetical protein
MAHLATVQFSPTLFKQAIIFNLFHHLAAGVVKELDSISLNFMNG